VRFSIARIFMMLTPQSLSGLVTLGLKYKLVTLTFGGARHNLISDAQAQCMHQFLSRMISMF
jgi:hypothetical protein